MKYLSHKILSIFASVIILSLFIFILSGHKLVHAEATSPWTQSSWSGGSGQVSWSNPNQFYFSTGITASTNVQLNLNWYNSSWTYRRVITIDHTKVGAALINYPLLINIPTDSALASHAQTNGNDILFTSSDATTKLNHEIEKYNSTTGSLQAWVKVPTVSNITDTVIYLYYGNAAATNQQNKTGVWDSNYAAVYHLGETSGNQNDSTSNANNSTAVHVTQQGANIGQVDGADQFNSTLDKLTMGNSLSLSPANDMTTEIWFNATASAITLNKVQTLFRQAHTTSPFQSWLVNDSLGTDAYCLNWNNTSLTSYSGCTKGNATTPNAWEYVVLEHTGTNFAAYLNGSANLGNNPTTSGTLLQANSNFYVGSNGGGTITNFGGIIDEVRVSNVARSSGYVSTVYNNLNSPSTFVTIGSESTKSSATGTLTSSIFDTGGATTFGTLTYTTTVPTNTTASVFVRTGNNQDLSDAQSFTSCTAIASGSSMNGNSCVINRSKYMQYQIVLNSTDFVHTPVFSSISLAFSQASAPASTGYIQRSGNSLYYNGSIFKFAGSDIYQLNLTDHPQTLTTVATQSGSSKATLSPANIDYATHFEIDAALQAAKLMGETVVRTFPLTKGCTICIETNKNVFNDASFDNVDYAIARANAYGIKLVIPFVDNWWYAVPGGKHNFTDWENDSNENDFYTNSTVISDFEAYISHVLNHVNTYTGVTYKNEQTIAWWSTGNELSSATPSWTQTIGSYIKSIDTNHLVEDGNAGSSGSNQPLSTAQLSQESALDIYSDHSYPNIYSFMQTDASSAAQYNKAFYIGEYDWTEQNGGIPLTTFLSNIENNNQISGDLFWNLWPVSDTNGFLSGDKYTFNYLADGSPTATRAAALRAHAYVMRGMTAPVYPTPGAPYLYTVTDAANGANLWWRGDPNAASYTVERSSDNGSHWTVLTTTLTDKNTPWNDTTASASSLYLYRVKALNANSTAGPYSNSQSWPGNVIRNGSIENATTANPFAYWQAVYQQGGAAAITLDSTTFEDGSHSAKINVTNTGSPSVPYNVQFRQSTINLTSGLTYTLTFWAKAVAARNIEVILQKPSSPFTVYYDTSNIAITTSWQKYTYTFIAANSDSAAYLNFNLSQATGNVWLDNITFIPTH